MGFLLFLILLVAAWQGIYWLGVDILQLWKPYAMPSPLGVAESFLDLCPDGRLLEATGNSLLRGIGGYAIALVIGVLLGLLRSIGGIFSPDSGVIDTMGNNVSLLSIGVGFQNELTGRDNIFLSGLLLGFTKEQIQEKYEEIVRFSELGNFINAPVKTYSSGMHSKLSFSITAVLETDIMLIDEVLSVGDRKFKKKSYAKMKELISNEDRTVMIVSHSAETIKKLCTRVIWLNDGEIVADGETGEVLKQYNEYMDYQEALMAKADKAYWYGKVKVKPTQILLYPTYARYCDDIRYLCQYILKHCPDWEVVWVKHKENEKIGISSKRLKMVLEKTPEYYRAIYSSKIILDDGMNLSKEDTFFLLPR